jgi:hypothetical protein
MATGISLHLGLNDLDPGFYGESYGTLQGSENDADKMQDLAASVGFSPVVLLSAQATYDAVKAEVLNATTALVAGDIFLWSFSGHGARLTEPGGKGHDTWQLFDGYMFDDEIRDLIGQFAPQVRIVVVSDSCSSGAVIRLAQIGDVIDETQVSVHNIRLMSRALGSKVLPEATRLATKDTAMNKFLNLESSLRHLNSANALLLSACQSDEQAQDGSPDSIFTTYLLGAWTNGRFRGTYQNLLDSTKAMLAQDGYNYQTPNYFSVGVLPNQLATGQAFSI